MEEDRSALFNQLKGFSQRKLKKVETKVVTASGEQLVEKRGAKGLQVLTGSDGGKDENCEPARKLDLQVGLIVPGFIIGSQDVAHDKSSLDLYGVTHILNLDGGVENKFEDDYNYKNVNIQDRPDFELKKVFEECFDYIDDGRHYGNVLVHCAGTVGLSRSTAICIAYLMEKEKQRFDEAFTNVKEARSFVKPNEGFIKQLKEFEVKLRGAQEMKDSGIDDPFALRKKKEIEEEKAMVAGAASVKSRMKLFGATLDPGNNNRSKSVSPSPYKAQPPTTSTPATNKWSLASQDKANDSKTTISKSMTPEPKKSWQSSSSQWKPSQSQQPGPPPPPPPSAEEKHSRFAPSNNKSLPPAPPPPPPPQADERTATRPKLPVVSDQNETKRMVFGRVPPPPMKIKGGLSIERQDTTESSRGSGSNRNSSQPKASLQLPLKKQLTSDSGGDATEPADNPRAPSPSAALRAVKQQVANKNKTDASNVSDQHRPSTCGQLNRSSTKKLLNLIKTKTKTDLTLSDGDENDEIEALLGALENESIDNIDWDELGLDEDEVKDIIEHGNDTESSSSDSSSSSSDAVPGSETDTDSEETEELETTTCHYVIRSK